VKHFTVHTDILTQRSKFLAAARKPEWLAGDPSRPVDLSDHDPDVFQAYLNCVYLGSDTLEEHPDGVNREILNGMTGFSDIVVYNICKEVTKETIVEHFGKFGELKTVNFTELSYLAPRYESTLVVDIAFTTVAAAEAALKACHGLVINEHQLTVDYRRKCARTRKEYHVRKSELVDSHCDSLIKLYLLTDKLQDTATANMVMDNLQQFCKAVDAQPGKSPITTAYQSTLEGSPLRRLLRDMWFYNAYPDYKERFQEPGFPTEFLHDMFKEYMRVKPESDDVQHYCEVATNDYLLRGPERDVPDRCRYHRHDEEHPLCSEVVERKPCKSCKATKKA